MPSSSKLRVGGRAKNASRTDDPTLERAKNIASIVSAIAIPLVLAVVGYWVQREFSNEGLKKDYVGIAAGILKEDAGKQEPDLRAWAAKVLEDNSPVPFSQKAKQGLITGAPVGPAWLSPPEICRKPPMKRNVYAELDKLSSDVKGLDPSQLLMRMQDFVDVVVKEEHAALENLARLECLQDWINKEEQMDIEYRKSIGAPSSKSVYDQLERSSASSSTAGKGAAPSLKEAGSPNARTSDQKRAH